MDKILNNKISILSWTIFYFLIWMFLDFIISIFFLAMKYGNLNFSKNEFFYFYFNSIIMYLTLLFCFLLLIYTIYNIYIRDSKNKKSFGFINNGNKKKLFEWVKLKKPLKNNFCASWILETKTTKNKKGHGSVEIQKEMTSCVVYGTTGSGKSKSLIYPTLEYNSKLQSKNKPSLIITDVKGELYAEKSDCLKNRGYKVLVLNIKDLSNSNSWNPFSVAIDRIKEYMNNQTSFDSIKKIKAIDNIEIELKRIEEFVFPRNKNEEKFEFFSMSAKKMLSAVLLSLAELVLNKIMLPDQINFSTVGKWISSVSSLKSLRDKMPKKEIIPNIHDLINESISIFDAEETGTGVIANLQSKMSLYCSNNSFKLASLINEFNFSNLDEEPTVIFLIVPQEDKKFNGLATFFIEQAYSELIRKGGEKRVLKRKILFILDEIMNFPEINNFHEKISLSREYGMFFQLFVQSDAQFDIVYPKTAAAIKASCLLTIILKLSGKDLITAQNYEKILGKRKIIEWIGRGDNKQRKISEVPILKADDMLRMNPNPREPGNFYIAILAGQKPIKCHFIYWPNVLENYRSPEIIDFPKNQGYSNPELLKKMTFSLKNESLNEFINDDDDYLKDPDTDLDTNKEYDYKLKKDNVYSNNFYSVIKEFNELYDCHETVEKANLKEMLNDIKMSLDQDATDSKKTKLLKLKIKIKKLLLEKGTQK